MKTNPNKVNQYTQPDPRQILFLKNYLNKKSKTFGDAYKSAIKATYSHEYAKTLTSVMPKWLSEVVRDTRILNQARKNLTYFLEETKEEKIKSDMTKFTLKGLEKQKWSERIDHTTKGEKITPIYGGLSNNTNEISKHDINKEDISITEKD